MDKKEIKRNNILNRLKERIDSGKGINYKTLTNEDPSLLYAIERYVGNISKACEALGISQKEMIEKHGFTNNINKHTLTEDEIKRRLIFLKSKGKLTTSAMRTEFDDLRLELSIKKVYGSVEKGLKYFGLERDTKRVTKESLIKQITEYSENGYDLCYSNMVKVDSALVSNSTNKFKMGWHEVLKYLSIDFNPKRIPFTRDNIKERLDRIFQEEGEINQTIIVKHDSSIMFYAYSNYDDIENFYLDMGYNPSECIDKTSQIYKGKRFELVFKEILEALEIEHIHNKHHNKKTRPDFKLENHIWIDCKLSSWTSSTKRTVEKYSVYCDKLIIVYLRGKKRKLYEYEDYNVEFRKVDYYYPLLIEIGREDLIYKCQGILNNESKLLESVTTERSIPSHENDGKVTV